MRNPKDFFKPMAIGAPDPVREVPFRPSRMIHFFDPSNPKMAAKAPSIAEKCDVLLGNLEDAIQADKKVEAREGFISIAKEANSCSPSVKPPNIASVRAISSSLSTPNSCR